MACQRTVHPTEATSSIDQQQAICGDPVFMSMHLAPESGLVSLMGSCNLMFMLCIGFLHHPSALTWTDLTCYDVVFTENADSTMHFCCLTSSPTLGRCPVATSIFTVPAGCLQTSCNRCGTYCVPRDRAPSGPAVPGTPAPPSASVCSDIPPPSPYTCQQQVSGH